MPPACFTSRKCAELQPSEIERGEWTGGWNNKTQLPGVKTHGSISIVKSDVSFHTIIKGNHGNVPDGDVEEGGLNLESES